ncbi:hypothetical protein [Neisseria sp.]|uniref:hypothetical protein n=1 Tax=Neisseria sp. TaxID=192066 RepID=UPI0025FB7918|nr:hypothetical protein [Neisseria sp.]
MFYIFSSDGHFAEQMAVMPPILPSRYFYLEVADSEEMGEYLFSDGRVVLSADVPPPSRDYILKNGEWVLPENYTEMILSAAKKQKLKDLNDSAQAFIDTNSGANLVPDFEFASWSIQASEAKAWQLDKNASTPVLDGIAAARGIPADTLKAAALRKTLAYEQLAAHVAGQRQALQSKIEAAKKQSDLDKIEIAFSLPEAV